MITSTKAKVPAAFHLAPTERLFRMRSARGAGTGAVEVPVLPTIDAGGGVRWDPISMRALPSYPNRLIRLRPPVWSTLTGTPQPGQEHVMERLPGGWGMGARERKFL